MSFTYDWSLTSLRKQNNLDLGLENVVIHTLWTVYGTDDKGNTGTCSAATAFDPLTINTSTFISYEDLTQDTVIGWIQNYISSCTGYQSFIDNEIQKNINNQLNVVTEAYSNNFPWITTSSSTVTNYPV